MAFYALYSMIMIIKYTCLDDHINWVVDRHNRLRPPPDSTLLVSRSWAFPLFVWVTLISSSQRERERVKGSKREEHWPRAELSGQDPDTSTHPSWSWPQASGGNSDKAEPRHNAQVTSVMAGGGVISDCHFMINENQTSSYLLCKDEQLTITRYSWVSLNTPCFSRC